MIAILYCILLQSGNESLDNNVKQTQPATTIQNNEDDFEAMVLKRMKQAEERKRLNEQLENEDDNKEDKVVT